MPTAEDRTRVASKIVELAQAEFHGHSTYWKDDRRISCDWHHYPNTDRSQITADLGDGFETKSWSEMDDEDRRHVLVGFVKSEGFTKEEFARVVDNVVKDEAANPSVWFDGVTEKSDYDRMLDEYADRAKYHTPDADLGIDR